MRFLHVNASFLLCVRRHDQRLEMILCGNPGASYAAHRAPIDAAIARVLEKGIYILGDETKAFEREFANWVGADHAVGVGSGTEALHLAMAAVDVGPGDEVITVAHTAIATVAAIELSGAIPVLVDIDFDTYTIDPQKIAGAITRRTKAILPVHLYGQMADLDPIMEIAQRFGIAVIEDCAQSHGAEYRGRRAGAMGTLGCFSFYPTKNLGAFGDGGAVVTSDAALADKVRGLREYGWRERNNRSLFPGWNSRLDELHAAVLRAKLGWLHADNRARRILAARYDAELAGLDLGLPRCRAQSSHVFHLYVVRSRARDALMAHLRQRNIMSTVHYPVPAHLQPAYAGRVATPGGMAQTEKAAAEILSLPIYPELMDDEQSQVIEAVKAFAVDLDIK